MLEDAEAVTVGLERAAKLLGDHGLSRLLPLFLSDWSGSPLLRSRDSPRPRLVELLVEQLGNLQVVLI